MARIDFPSNPSNGQTLTVNVAGANTVYTYNSTYGVWRSKGTATTISSGGGASVTTSNTTPSSPSSGDLWWNSMDGNMYVYYNDGDSNQWVQSNPAQPGPAGSAGPAGASANLTSISSNLIPSANVTYDIGTSTSSWKDLYLSGNSIYLAGAQISKNVSGGIDLPSGSKVGGTAIGTGSGGTSVITYANSSIFPSSNNTVGDFAFATNNKTLHVWDGAEWDRVYSGPDMVPEFTTAPASSYSLVDGTNTVITIAATDPDGFPITYSHDTNPTGQPQATITQSGGTFTLVPSSNTSHAGSFTMRFKATDGVHVSSQSATMQLSFAPLIDYLVVAGGGGGGGGDNGSGAGGGGGAGGVLANTNVQLATGVTYDIAVGTGGAGGNYNATSGSNGGSSTISGSGFTTVTAVGGGYGAMLLNTGGPGGSGGGGGGRASYAGGSGTAGQGNPGGTGSNGGGGGGGAGFAGTNASGSVGGPGGDGLYSSISGANTAYGGGGGGGGNSSGDTVGTGGVGGGANGGNGVDAVDGYGGGGGGQSGALSNGGGDGGNGVVIIRTLKLHSAVTTTGSVTHTTDGSYNIYTYTGTGTISWS